MNVTTRRMIGDLLKLDAGVGEAERRRVLAALVSDGAGRGVVSRREVAARLGCSVRWVDSLCVRGLLDRVALPGAKRRSAGITAASLSRVVGGCGVKLGKCSYVRTDP
jgi:hypothetical protein